jgi:hypothetical protein
VRWTVLVVRTESRSFDFAQDDRVIYSTRVLRDECLFGRALRERRVLRVANADSSLWARNDKELGLKRARGLVVRNRAGFFPIPLRCAQRQGSE